mgnify:CR=1 FL=1
MRLVGRCTLHVERLLSMKKTFQIEILHWAKTKHNVDTKYIHKSLSDKDFNSLCLLLHKNRGIGSVVDTKEMVSEYLKEHGIQYIPQSFNGVDVDLNFFFNTHPLQEDGSIEVDLYHILLHSWCKPSRINYRILKKHLKELGYGLKTSSPTYSNHTENCVVSLKTNYPLSLPKTLTRNTKSIKWYAEVHRWIYLESPKIELNGETYTLNSIGERWEAYFTKRLIDLFVMSETPYLHKHPQVRGAYENAPPVLALCELTLRDVFKPTKLKDWVNTALRTSDLETYGKESEVDEVFLDTVYDEVCGKLSKTMIKGNPIKSFDVVGGWISIIVIAYLNDILSEYRSLL